MTLYDTVWSCNVVWRERGWRDRYRLTLPVVCRAAEHQQCTTELLWLSQIRETKTGDHRTPTMVLKTIVGNSKSDLTSVMWVRGCGYSVLCTLGLLSHVLRHNQKSDKVDWRVLVVDKVSIKILSTCIKMHQLNKEGITRELTLLSVVQVENIFL